MDIPERYLSIRTSMCTLQYYERTLIFIDGWDYPSRDTRFFTLLQTAMLLNIVLHFLVLGQALALVKPAKQLVSPLIPSKLLATTKSLPSPIKYPQWTTSTGSWSFFPPDSWTSGFLSTSLYALNTRKTLCGATAKNQLGIADWIQLGRETSAALAQLTINNGVGHDVGFLSYPFMEELKVCVDFFCRTLRELISVCSNSKNTTAARIINEFAMTLAERFNPTVGCTRSWGETDSADFQVRSSTL